MQQKLSFTNIILSILVIAFCFLFPHFGIIPIPFAYTIPVLIIIWLFLKITKENFSDLGFSLKRFEIRSIFYSLIAAIILFAFLNKIFFPFLDKIIVLPKPNLDDFKNIKGHFFNYIFILLMGCIVGGFYEELVFHGFIFTRFEKIISGKYAMLISFILTNIIFGLYHVQLGTSGMINAFIAGCAYHAFMLKFKRNMWYAIFFHAFFDTIGLTFLYLGYW